MIAGPEELKTDSAKKENSSAKQEKPAVKKGSVLTESVVKTIVKKKPKRLVTNAIAYIKATFNNTIINIVDQQGNSLCWSSGGAIGFKGSRKSTPFAAKRAAESVADKARKMGVREIAVKVKGPGSGRESAIRALQSAGLQIKTIEDITPLPHNGCRARKRRRV